jgi:hypothetical protein
VQIISLICEATWGTLQWCTLISPASPECHFLTHLHGVIQVGVTNLCWANCESKKINKPKFFNNDKKQLMSKNIL